MSIDIPRFVTRGLGHMPDPTLADPMTVRYRTEADLRDSMAALWWLHGWDVSTEVKVPDCGRIDVLAERGNVHVVIEIKREIKTPTQARMAFQQAHAYRAYLDADAYEKTPPEDRMRWEGRQHFVGVVTAAHLDYSATRSADRAFTEVFGAHWLDAAELAFCDRALFVPGVTEAYPAARRVAARRESALRQIANAARGAACVATLAQERSFIEAVA